MPLLQQIDFFILCNVFNQSMYNSSEGNEFSITQGIKEKTVSDHFELDLSFSYLQMYLKEWTTLRCF